MIGIYKITSPTNRIYIGQSVNIEKRFRRYKIIASNVKGQTRLFRSLTKYGSENHFFEVIEECEIDKLNERERYYQDLYNCIGDNGLNCKLTKVNDRSGKVSKFTLSRISKSQLGNNNWLGKKHTQETKDKISKANKGRRYSKEINLKKGRKGIIPPLKGIFGVNHPLSKKVIQYDLYGNIIKEWDCLSDIKRDLFYHIGNISSCCSGNLKTYKGYIWKYK